MNHSRLLPLLLALGLTACTPPTPTPTKPKATYESPTPQKQQRYQSTMIKIASTIKDDTHYRRIALDTPEKKAWFKSLTYRLWDREITRHQFIAEGLAKYPTHRYEFAFVVKGFSRY